MVLYAEMSGYAEGLVSDLRLAYFVWRTKGEMEKLFSGETLYGISAMGQEGSE